MGGFGLEALGGVGAVVLGILGLAGILPHHLAAIAVIVLGAATLSEGGAIAAKYSEMLRDIGGGTVNAVELGSGVTTEFIGGVGAIVLGILALLGMAPTTLVAVAIIALGATLLLSSGETSRLAALGWERGAPTARAMHLATSSASGGQVLLGLAAIILGILSLVMGGPHELLLALIGIICIGAALLFSGTAIAGRLMSQLR